MNKLAIIRIKFNIPYSVFGNKFKDERLTQSWIDYRMDIFMKYTYQSLIQQTNQEFIALIHYDPLSEHKIQTSLKRYPDLQKNVIFVPDMNKAITKYIQNSTDFFLVYLDSDNMFHPSFISRLYAIDLTNLQFVICQTGYAIDVNTQQIGYYHHPIPDTFYSFIYHTQDYLNGYRLPIPINRYNEIINRSQYLSQIKYIEFSDPLFVIIIHDKVMTHSLTNMLKIQTVLYLIDDSDEKQKILSTFHIAF